RSKRDWSSDVCSSDLKFGHLIPQDVFQTFFHAMQLRAFVCHGGHLPFLFSVFFARHSGRYAACIQVLLYQKETPESKTLDTTKTVAPRKLLCYTVMGMKFSPGISLNRFFKLLLF